MSVSKMKKRNGALVFAAGFVLLMMTTYCSVGLALRASSESSIQLVDGRAIKTPFIEHTQISMKQSRMVSLVMYSDFQCPACAFIAGRIPQLVKQSRKTMQVTFRHYPLKLHRNSMNAAIASEAAARQGKFWEMHDLLFRRQKEWSHLSDPERIFVQYAAELGLDPARFVSDQNDESLRDSLFSDRDAIEGMIPVTPTIFVNGKIVAHPTDLIAIAGAIDDAKDTK